MPTVPRSTMDTAIGRPISRVRNCSSFSVFSSLPGGEFTKLCRKFFHKRTFQDALGEWDRLMKILPLHALLNEELELLENTMPVPLDLQRL